MAGRFRVSTAAEKVVTSYGLCDMASGAPCGAVEVSHQDGKGWLRLVDAQGVESARSPLEADEMDADTMHKAVRRFLAQVRPGDFFEFDAQVSSASDLDMEDEEDEDSDEDEDDDEA